MKDDEKAFLDNLLIEPYLYENLPFFIYLQVTTNLPSATHQPPQLSNFHSLRKMKHHLTILHAGITHFKHFMYKQQEESKLKK